jgi:hypothetical protein
MILGDTYAFGVFKGKSPGDLYRLGQVSLGDIECFAGLAQLGIWILSDARWLTSRVLETRIQAKDLRLGSHCGSKRAQQLTYRDVDLAIRIT